MHERVTSAGRRGLDRHAGRAAGLGAVLLATCASPQVVSDTEVQSAYGAAGLPAGMMAEQSPNTFPSSWHAANWKARSAALAAKGLTAVGLTALPAAAMSTLGKNDIPPGVFCQRVEVTIDGQKQPAMYNPSGSFAFSKSGTLHCLVVTYQSLGEKLVRIQGHRPNCSTGAQLPHLGPNYNYLYAIPAGVPIGEIITLAVPTYTISATFTEECPKLP